jgi:hypothetical protein
VDPIGLLRRGPDRSAALHAGDSLPVTDPGNIVTTSSEVDLPSGEPDPQGTPGGQGTPAGQATQAPGQETAQGPGSQGSHRAPAPSAGSRLASLQSPKVIQAGIATLGILLLLAAYIGQARTMATISEGASQALQGWDMLHGNLLLHGWSLSDVSFWTTELPEYALIEAIKGLNANTVPIAAAISYWGQVVLAAFLARGRSTGKEGWVKSLIAVGIMIAPTLGPATALLMSSPDHTGTHVPLLFIYLVVDRVRPRWWVPIVIGVLLTWAQVADALVLVEGALPIAAVYVVRMYRRGGPWKAQWYDASMVVAALLSAVLSKEILKAVLAAGGFYVRTPIAAFGTPAQISSLFWAKIEYVLLVFGADFFGKILGGSAVIALVHLVGVGLVAWALGYVLRRFYIEDDQILQMLTVAFLVVLGAYVLGTKPDSNEIVGLLPIGAVLAGRALGPKVMKIGLVPALSAVFAILAIFLIHNAATPAQTNPNAKVAVWLQQHHLTYGLAGYWNASSVTAETGGNIKVRPVRTFQDQVVAANFETDSYWYDPSQHYANFVIRTTKSCGNLCLTMKGLNGAFGQPAHTYDVGPYIVFVYTKNLLPSVRYVSFCGSAWPWVAHGTPSNDLHCNSSGSGV